MADDSKRTFLTIEDETGTLFTISDAISGDIIVYPTRLLADLDYEDALDMGNILGELDPSVWRKPPIFIRHLTKPSTYLALDKATDKFEWNASQYAHRFESRAGAASVLDEHSFEGIIQDMTSEVRGPA
jgi:hypothetical protein